jgi:programmed cell death protein 4
LALAEILPPAFLTDPLVVGLGGETAEKAKRMLSRDHQYSRLEKSWGPGDGRPVAELKKEMDALLGELLVSGDVAEAERCVRLLQCAYYHHELVKRAVVCVADKEAEQQATVGALLAHLHAAEVLSSAQLQLGLGKVHAIMGDLALDAPGAPAVLDYFVQHAIENFLVPGTFALSKAPHGPAE